MGRTKNHLKNRVRAVMAHTTRYAFMGSARLAADASISASALSRLMAGKSSPSFEVVQALTATIEKALKRPIDPRDLIAVDGKYPTRYVCAASGCKGCLPDAVYARDGSRKREYLHVKPGLWTGDEFSGKGAL